VLYLTVLILLTIFLYIRFKKILNKSLTEKRNNYEYLKLEYERLNQENIRLKNDNSNLERSVEETIALYDITKDICKSLDEDKVFKIFCERINRYIEIEDCRFLKEGADLLQYENYTVLPLVINKATTGYLVASGIGGKDKEKFHILTQQFLIGIRRAILYQKVQELTITDSLTQVFNRRYFLERFNEEFDRSRKFKYNLSFLIVDIDHFKNINDNYGHLVGDAILREITKTIKENIRQIDFMGRYGGEELSIILIETDKGPARLAAERIRQSIESRRFAVYDENLKVTISIGISTFPEDANDTAQLIDKADKALYKAKLEGRNRVCVYDEGCQ
jgi:diguanylate cyclase (GGDEF)-like protein